jgi:hypothetical protein
MQPVANIVEKLLAAKMLASAAGHSSSQLSSFSGWLITGFAAGFGLLLANIESISKFVEPRRVGLAILFFLGAVLVHVVQRWLAAITAGSIAAGNDAGTASANHNQEIDFKVVFAEMERASYRPARWFIRRSFAKVASGDLAGAGRMQFKLAQW